MQGGHDTSSQIKGPDLARVEIFGCSKERGGRFPSDILIANSQWEDLSYSMTPHREVHHEGRIRPRTRGMNELLPHQYKETYDFGVRSHSTPYVDYLAPTEEGTMKIELCSSLSKGFSP